MTARRPRGHPKKEDGSDPIGTSQINIGSDYTPDELELLRAADIYKQVHKRRFVTLRDMLVLVKELGYVKTNPPSSAPLPGAGVAP